MAVYKPESKIVFQKLNFERSKVSEPEKMRFIKLKESESLWSIEVLKRFMKPKRLLLQSDASLLDSVHSVYSVYKSVRTGALFESSNVFSPKL